MKAMSAEMTAELLEISRQACGGHGYLAASALGDAVASAKALVTVEGENTVLYLQVARCVMWKKRCFKNTDCVIYTLYKFWHGRYCVLVLKILKKT